MNLYRVSKLKQTAAAAVINLTITMVDSFVYPIRNTILTDKVIGGYMASTITWIMDLLPIQYWLCCGHQKGLFMVVMVNRPRNVISHTVRPMTDVGKNRI